MVFPSAVSVWETVFSSEKNGVGGARARPEDVPAQTSRDVEVRQALGEVDLLRRKRDGPDEEKESNIPQLV